MPLSADTAWPVALMMRAEPITRVASPTTGAWPSPERARTGAEKAKALIASMTAAARMEREER
mgnify:CR=1 FL=1